MWFNIFDMNPILKPADGTDYTANMHLVDKQDVQIASADCVHKS